MGGPVQGCFRPSVITNKLHDFWEPLFRFKTDIPVLHFVVSIKDKAKCDGKLKRGRPPIEDELKNEKKQYISNHWSDLTQI